MTLHYIKTSQLTFSESGVWNTYGSFLNGGQHNSRIRLLG